MLTASILQAAGQPTWRIRDEGDTVTKPADNANRTRTHELSAATIYDLLAPLTVIKAQAQMVARWAQRNNVAEPDAVLARLAVIDTMVTRLVLELDGLREARPSQQDEAADGQ